MKKFLLSLCLSALMLGAPQPVRAEVEDGTEVSVALIAPLMAWVEHRTGVKVPVLPQVIASRSQFHLVLGRMGANFAGIPQSAYVPGTVYLDNENWDADDPVQMSLLVHELVHHAQLFMTKAKWPCPDAREAQAYNLQNAWMEEHGHSAVVPASWVTQISSCGQGGGGVFLAQKAAE